MSLKVCIGITTYNRASILRTAIRSAMEQDYENKTIVVVDDGSTDETAQIQSEFPQIKWHRNESSQGYRAARNKMMSETDADLFCSLDDDSWFMTSDGLTEGVKLFEATEKLGAVGFEILDQGHPNGYTELKVRPSNMFVGCGHLLRISAVRQVGFYHKLPGEYGGEEKDLSIRLLNTGYEVVELQGVHVWHDKTFQARNVPQQHFSGVCNDLALTLHRAPIFMLIWLLPAKILSHLKFAVFFGLRNVNQMSTFANHIRETNGRFVFVSPTIRAISVFIWRAFGDFRRREPVRIEAFRKFLGRSCGSAG